MTRSEKQLRLPVRVSRAFSSDDETYYLSGNLENVPLIGPTCVCGKLLPPNEGAQIPLPIIQVEERCGQ